MAGPSATEAGIPRAGETPGGETPASKVPVGKVPVGKVPDGEIPASIAAAWGVRERPHKGPKPALSLARIVDAAVRVADTEGLDAVSMGRVAAEVGAVTCRPKRNCSS